MSKFRDDRIAKLEQMRAAGIEPFGTAYPDSTPARQLVESYTDDAEGTPAKAAGRLTAIRGHGKSTFADLTDWTGKVQVHLGLKRIGEEPYAVVKLLDIGDVIGVEGQIGKTRTGEVTLFADKFTVLEPLDAKAKVIGGK